MATLPPLNAHCQYSLIKLFGDQYCFQIIRERGNLMLLILFKLHVSRAAKKETTGRGNANQRQGRLSMYFWGEGAMERSRNIFSPETPNNFTPFYWPTFLCCSCLALPRT
jgi:hypothetical protein